LIHTVNKGRRVPSTVFLDGHKNITVKCDTMVHRLLFKDKMCVGVATHPDDPTQQYFAKHEVIICGGVFESPKLLMLSGIGPMGEGSDLNMLSSLIERRVDSPHVGQNLQDHPVCPHSFKLKDNTSLDSVMRPGPKHIEAMAQYKLSKTGPLCSSLLEMSGFARVDAQFEKCREWREERDSRGHDPMGPRGQPHFEYDFLVCIQLYQ
jgi:choline dehydrogenase